AGAIEVDEALQVIGELRPLLGLADGETVLWQPGMAHMGDTGQDGTEGLPVADHARQRDTADIDAMIGTLSADEALTLAFAAYPVIGEGDLDGRIDRFGAGIAEEDVVEIARHQIRHLAGQLEGGRMRHLEMRGIVDLE